MKISISRPSASTLSPALLVASLKNMTLPRCTAWFVPAVALAVTAMPATAVATLFVVDLTLGTVGAYTNSGATINASLISGLNQPRFAAVSGGFLYVTTGDGTIGKYTTSGATVNASLITGLSRPADIEISGGHLFVANAGNGTIGEYTTSGATVDASLIAGLGEPFGLAVSGTRLFVADLSSNTIGEYTTSGATVNASLIDDSLINDLTDPLDVETSGSSLFFSYTFIDDAYVGKYRLDGTALDPRLTPALPNAYGIAISGTDLFVAGDDVSKFTTSGAVIDDPLINGLRFPYGIAVEGPSSVPETFSTWWLGLTAAGLLAAARFRRQSA